MLDTKFSELPVLIEYGVPESDQQKAMTMVEHFSHDPLVINILHEFYSHLPEAEDDCILEFFLLEQLDGVQLFLVRSNLGSYFYLVNRDKAELVGTVPEGPDENSLHFFGFSDGAAFQKKYGDFKDLTSHANTFIGKEACPSCFCKDGDSHVFGCPVEICPWCDGQLTNCNCRFDQLKVDEIKNQMQLDSFLKLLHKKGRISYDAASHCPSYPVQNEEINDRSKEEEN